MDDKDIVALYLQKDEAAIRESEAKYGRYLHTVAYNVLYDHEDAGECVNDTYMGAWKSIPPKVPSSLRAFLSRITRNLAINRYHAATAEKRSGRVDEVAEEFFECVPSGGMSVEDEVILRTVINGFLASLAPQMRILFMQRYYYMCSVKQIAKLNCMSESNVKVTLMRQRENFRKYLEKEGYTV